MPLFDLIHVENIFLKKKKSQLCEKHVSNHLRTSIVNENWKTAFTALSHPFNMSVLQMDSIVVDYSYQLQNSAPLIAATQQTDLTSLVALYRAANSTTLVTNAVNGFVWLCNWAKKFLLNGLQETCQESLLDGYVNVKAHCTVIGCYKNCFFLKKNLTLGVK